MTYFKSSLSEKDFYLSLANRPRKAGVSSSFRGVSRISRSPDKWRAGLTYKGRRYYLGSHDTEIEAAKAYNKAALAIIGDHAVINHLPEHDYLQGNK
jgi:hypothetical protein